ncbi:MAG: glycosyltransferase [Methanobacterium sp. ERen5]|nr:MAG: glycosyltransferase [Methanobacterium sp. ERen5]
MPKMFKLVSKNGLRMIKYRLHDDYSLFKHEIQSVKAKIFNPQEIIESNRPKMNLLERKEKYNELIRHNNELMDLFLFKDDSPKVSIIINLDSTCDLNSLFNNFHHNLVYPNFEVIVIDNHLAEDSGEFFSKLKNQFSVDLIENSEGLSYAKIHNSTVESATGEYLLFLDGNLKPTYGWLNSLMQTTLETMNTGCVGTKIVDANQNDSTNDIKIQSIGTEFVETKNGNFQVSEMANGLDPTEEISMKQNLRAAVTQKAFLIDKALFLEMGGFDESYKNSFEGVDLSLKLFKKGYSNIYNPYSLIFGCLNSEDPQRRNSEDDLIRFNNKWKQFLRGNVLMDKIESNHVFSLEKLKLGFAVSESGENATAGDYFTAKEFGEAIKSLGWDVCFLSRDGPDYWYDLDDVDVVISLLYTFDPRRIRSSKGSLIKIAWPRNWFDRWTFFPWFESYDLVLVPSKISQRFVKEHSGKDATLVPLATNPNRFNNNIPATEDYFCDYCFTGSYWNDYREIIDLLDPDKLPYKFNLYGKNWELIPKFKPYHRGFINYINIPKLYASTKIVIDDANSATKAYGSVNSRVYDALACGTLVLTNGKLGALEIFGEDLPVFETETQLNLLLNHYLEADDDRINLVEKLQKFVVENHTYFNRAEHLKKSLIEYIHRKQS